MKKHGLVALITTLLFLSCGMPKKSSSEEVKTSSEEEPYFGLTTNIILDELYKRDQIIYLKKDSLTVDLKNIMVPDTIKGRGPASFVDFETFSNEQLFEILEKLENDDNRKDFYKVNKPSVKRNFKGVAVVMYERQIKSSGLFKSKQMSEREYQVGNETYVGCSTNKYFKQFTLATCTAFAISRWHVVTAGHEVNRKNLNDFEFVFDMIIDEEGKFPNSISSSKRFKAVRIEKHKSDEKTGLDYTIVRVNKPISEDRILNINLSFDYNSFPRLYAVGAAEGLPLKYVPDGFIDEVTSEHLLSTDLNVFEGNSGSPVFNEEDEVIGMVIKGQERHFLKKETNCVKANSCSKYQCGREYVLKINSIPLKNYIN